MTRTRKAPALDDVATGELRVLLVTARGGAEDIGVRVIRRPLLRALGTAVPVDIVRPGTFDALAQALSSRPHGHYPVVHLDMHGRVSENGGLLFFEQPGPRGVIGIEAAEVATLLGERGVRLVVLNACQSSMPVGDEASIAAMLVRAGVRTAVGMRYSITVDGAVRFSSAFYRALAAGTEVAAATRDARAAMYAQRLRDTVLGIDAELDDWLLPICHQAGPLRFCPAPEPVTQAVPAADPPGRDAAIMHIERRIAAGRPGLVVHGLIGSGKTALLRQLATEWKSTGFTAACLVVDFEESGWDAEAVRQRLPASGRWALMIDHPHRARPADLADLCSLLAGLGQRTNPPVAVLVADRHPGSWATGALGADVYELTGIDHQAAYALARAALGDDRHHELLRESSYRRCLQILSGNPGALEAAWRTLAEHDPRRVLAVLQGGELTGPDVTLRRLRESLAALAPADREAVERLSPYTGPIAADRLPTGDRPHGFDPAHHAGLVTVSDGSVVPHPLLGPAVRHALSARPDLLIAARSEFLNTYLAVAAQATAALERGEPELATATVIAERENWQTALALALVRDAPDVNLVRALDLAFVGEGRSYDRVALYDTVLTWFARHPQHTGPRQLIYEHQQVYALVAAGRLDDAEQAHEQLLKHLDQLARTEPEAAAAARLPILHSGGILAIRRGDRAAAWRLFEGALRGAGVDGPDGATATHFELGRIALEEGRPKVARRYLDAALPGMRQPPARHAWALLVLARAERADGDPVSAAKHLEEARLELLANAANYATLLDVLLETVHLAIDGGQLDAAAHVLSEAGDLVKAAADTRGLARLSLATAGLSAARHDDETATAAYERAARLAEQTRDQATAIEAYRRHADLVAIGDPGLANVLRRRANVLASDQRLVAAG